MSALPDNTPSLTDVAHEIAPDLRIVSASQPVPKLRTHNVVALAGSAERARHAVLALERLEYDDDKLGTVVMSRPGSLDEERRLHGDHEGVSRVVVPRVLLGGAIGAAVGFVVIGLVALGLGVTGWQAVGAALGGLMMFAVLGAIWVTFAGMGGSDAYRQTFVDEDVTELTIVSLHTDDAQEAEAAEQALVSDPDIVVLHVGRNHSA
jgi:hypothetical protein